MKTDLIYGSYNFDHPSYVPSAESYSEEDHGFLDALDDLMDNRKPLEETNTVYEPGELNADMPMIQPAETPGKNNYDGMKREHQRTCFDILMSGQKRKFIGK